MKEAIYKAARQCGVQFFAIKEYLQNGIVYNPLLKTFTQNPYPTYAMLRKCSPIHRSLLTNTWVITRYKDVETILRDYKRFSNNPQTRLKRGGHKSTLPPGPDDYSVLLVDPPDHTRLRKVVSKGFNPQALKALEPQIQATTQTLLDAIPDLQPFDLMKDIARPLSMMTMSQILGIPSKDQPNLEKWAKQRAKLLELTVSTADRESATKSGKEEMNRYFSALVEKRRVDPKPDIISLLAAGGDLNHQMAHHEAVDMLSVLLVAGNETTSNLMGNGMLALLKHPRQMEKLCRDTSMVKAAVEEMLRYDGPVQTDFRIAREKCEVAGVTIQQGDGIILLIGAANRDPEAFERAEEFDIERKNPAHLAFGKGIHHCVGAPLARLQVRIAIQTILEQLGRLELTESQPRFYDNSVVRGMESLRVKASPKNKRKFTDTSHKFPTAITDPLAGKDYIQNDAS